MTVRTTRRVPSSSSSSKDATKGLEVGVSPPPGTATALARAETGRAAVLSRRSPSFGASQVREHDLNLVPRPKTFALFWATLYHGDTGWGWVTVGFGSRRPQGRLYPAAILCG